MFYQKKLDRAMKWLKEKNSSQNSDYDIEEGNNNVELEKRDLLAIIISALLVFGPIFIIAIVIFVLVVKL